MSKPRKIFVSAGEYSGSVYVASVVRELKKNHPELEFMGVGGKELERSGVKILHNSDNWGSIGMVEALKRWRLILVNWQIQNYFEQEKPDLVILSDYPGFNMPLARKARSLKIPSVYIFPPRKFAQDPNSIIDAASNIKRVAAEFEPTYDVYKKAGATVDFVGHPMIDSLPVLKRNEIREEFGILPGEKLLIIMPGSRSQEIKLMLPLYLQVVENLYKNGQKARFHLLGAENLYEFHEIRNFLEDQVLKLKRKGVPIELYWKDRFKSMVAADMAMVTSGTATLELAFYQVPMVICYRVTALTAFLARFFTELPQFIGLPNLLSGKEVAPEFIQEDANPQKLGQYVSDVLDDNEKLDEMREELCKAIQKLGKGGAILRINHLIEEELGL